MCIWCGMVRAVCPSICLSVCEDCGQTKHYLTAFQQAPLAPVTDWHSRQWRGTPRCGPLCCLIIDSLGHISRNIGVPPPLG